MDDHVRYNMVQLGCKITHVHISDASRSHFRTRFALVSIAFRSCFYVE